MKIQFIITRLLPLISILATTTAWGECATKEIIELTEAGMSEEFIIKHCNSSPKQGKSLKGCNGYAMLTGTQTAGHPHQAWTGHINLRTRLFDFTHPLGGHSWGEVINMNCNNSTIQYTLKAANPPRTEVCRGGISSQTAAGQCNYGMSFTFSLTDQF